MSDTDIGVGKALQLLLQDGESVIDAPDVDRTKGTGNRLGEALRHPELGEYQLRTMHFTVKYIPVSFRGFYLVSHPRDKNGTIDRDAFVFHRKLTDAGIDAALGAGTAQQFKSATMLRFRRRAFVAVPAFIAAVILAVVVAKWAARVF